MANVYCAAYKVCLAIGGKYWAGNSKTMILKPTTKWYITIPTYMAIVMIRL